MIEKVIKKCRICYSSHISLVLDLGTQPPANRLHNNKNFQKKFNLKLLICDKCRTLQISNSLDPKFLFKKYLWVTGTSKAAQIHANKFFKLTSKYLKKNSTILEIASNDGTFLYPFQKKNYKVLGVDPAKNIADIANSNNIKTLPDFFSYRLSNNIKKKYKNISLIFARNVIPHVKNIHSVVKGISNLSNKNTTVAIEFHYSKYILDELQYDSIYHEHIFYFSIKTLSQLFKKYNLKPIDVYLSPISGGSLILIFSKFKNKKSKALIKLEKQEEKTKMNTKMKWLKFSKDSINHSINFKNKIMKTYVKNRKRLFGYGASARSSTLLNFCNLNKKYFKFIIDQNPLKRNLYTPGSNIKIINLEDAKNELRKRNMVLLAWNFKKEILSLMKSIKYKKKIIIPIKKKNEN